MPGKVKKKCSCYGCPHVAVSSRAQFCRACFKKNAVSSGSRRGNAVPSTKKCSTYGCSNEVQGSRWARLCAACFSQKQVELTTFGGKRSALASNEAALARMPRSRKHAQRRLDQARWDGARRFTRRRILMKLMSADSLKKVFPASVRDTLRGIAWLHRLPRDSDASGEKANPTVAWPVYSAAMIHNDERGGERQS